MERTLTSYDLLAYPSFAFPLTHPDNMATIARLFGLSPPPVERCRVLEIGCAGAGNLIPMAANLPDSTFLGIDLSPRQIEAGREVFATLRLTNIDLRAVDIAEIDGDFGLFDFIICHGVLSWVDERMQERILAVFQRNLAENGVAYVSYNVYPGWYEGRMLRDMLRYHCRDVESPIDQVQRARQLIARFEGIVRSDEDTRAAFLRPELQHLSRPDKDAYLFSEYLAESNRPLLFHELVMRAQAHGLQYLSNAEPLTMWVDHEPDPIADVVKRCRTVVEAQQMLDFLRNRRLRSTLLCHSHHRVDMNLRPDRIVSLSASASMSPDPANGDLRSEGRATIRSRGGSVAWVAGPANRLALSTLTHIAPKALAFDDLVAQVRSRLSALNLGSGEVSDFDRLRSDLAATLTHLYFADVVELHSYQADVACELSERPRATPLARLESERTGIATTQWHGRYYLSPLHRALLQRLDGTVSAAELVRAIGASGFDDSDPSPPAEQVDDALHDLLDAGLLVG